MRVLATFPELVGPPPAADATGHAPPADHDAGVRPVEASIEPPPPVRPRGLRPIRVTPRPRFPLASIAALGLVTAVLWMLVAMREAATPGRRGPEERLAAEPVAEAVR
ncbi:MAG: hypothetical protein ACKOCX_07150 [Planctomycetota bacterium]